MYPPQPNPAEDIKRRRERRVALLFGVGFLVSTLLQATLTARRQTYGFVQSLLYFGLIHLNLILIMLLVFLVSRNLIKAYLVRRTGTLGSSLRWRMVTALLGFSLLPSIILFTGSSYIIRQGFDRWFGTQVARALDDAEAITNVHYNGIEENLEFFTARAQKQIQALGRLPNEKDIEVLREEFPVQAVEVYFDLVTPPLRLLKPGLPEWMVPRAALESLTRALQGESFHLIRQYGDGDLVQRFAYMKLPVRQGVGFESFSPDLRPVVLVLSETVPLGLKTRIADLQSAFSGYQKTRLLKNDLKATYTLVLLTLFLLTMFVVSWFGLYLAKNVTDPVAELLKGTQAFREGRWDYRIPTSLLNTDKRLQSPGLQGAGADLEVLKAAFNLMAEEVGLRGQQLEQANNRLTTLVRELSDRERYLETLLASIRRGVVVIDNGGYIQRINLEAAVFCDEVAELHTFVGRHWREVFSQLGTEDDTAAWLLEAAAVRGQPVDRILESGADRGRASSYRSVRCSAIQLRDDRANAFGWMIILEDVSDAARLERLAAWQEVARRVAHEIKNPLTPIQLSIDRLARRMTERMSQDAVDGPVFRESVSQIQKQVRVIRDLVREFSEFSKLPEPKFTSVHLANLIQETLKDYRFNHPDCEFSFAAPSDASRDLVVRADPDYLRRLMVNVADNAVHSMEAAKTKSPSFRVTMVPPATENDSVAIVFEDNGPGISPSMREKIFDPYVTSKASGMGLGLAIVRRIAMEHSGRIRCEEAQGGRFVLELPVQGVGDSIV
ncbi:MAG: GHKL domain-containing protein [Bdellovibrionales bacterium]|nr:GHKL domain-containing protein [Bdellovibrionales bacterium]